MRPQVTPSIRISVKHHRLASPGRWAWCLAPCIHRGLVPGTATGSPGGTDIARQPLLEDRALFGG